MFNVTVNYNSLHSLSEKFASIRIMELYKKCNARVIKTHDFYFVS